MHQWPNQVTLNLRLTRFGAAFLSRALDFLAAAGSDFLPAI
jgi:hypothetical protein